MHSNERDISSNETLTTAVKDASQPRRALLQGAAALVAAHLASDVSASGTAKPAQPATKAKATTKNVDNPAKPGDFAFLTGEWRISNRKRKKPGENEWDEFPGEATVWSILGGVGSVEELRIPARDFSGMGLRLVWSDHWVNGKSGVVVLPGSEGRFIDGAGVFGGDWVDPKTKKKVLARSVWDRITPTSCRWHQATSRDGGKTWEDDWLMDWVRVMPAVPAG
jgi:hypothetical protein